MSSWPKNWQAYRKFIVAFVAAAGVIATTIVSAVDEGFGDGTWDGNDTLKVVVAAIGAFGVLFAENDDA